MKVIEIAKQSNVIPFQKREDRIPNKELDESKVVFVSENGDYKITLGDLTCFDCEESDRCPHAWDIYNIEGDCVVITGENNEQ